MKTVKTKKPPVKEAKTKKKSPQVKAISTTMNKKKNEARLPERKTEKGRSLKNVKTDAKDNSASQRSKKVIDLTSSKEKKQNQVTNKEPLTKLAMSSYFEEIDEEPESQHEQVLFPRPGSPKPAFPPPNTSRIATFASLLSRAAAEDDEEEGQAFYAGGSERSGQQVLGPGKRKAGNEVVSEMFKAVRQSGGEVVDKNSSSGHGSASRPFHGSGHVLGSTEGVSPSVSARPSASNSREVDVRLRMWQTGFTVDDGPLRDYHDPDNRAFLDSVRKGEIPAELLAKSGNAEVHLNLEDHSEEAYAPKKPSVQAFSGAGFRLGNITPAVHTDSAQSGEKKDDVAQNNLELDESKPVTSIQIRLADGTRLVMKANHTHTVGDVRRYIVTARPEYSGRTFSLVTAFPPTLELSEDDSTLEAQNLLNSVIVQKLK